MKDISGAPLRGHPELMMESFVELADSMASAKGLTKAELAQLAWPESSPRVASYRWQSMRTKVRNTGKPQGVLISDAVRLAKALDQHLAYMFILAEERATKKMAALEGEKTVARPARKKKVLTKK
jgi:hypothetical protein